MRFAIEVETKVTPIIIMNMNISFSNYRNFG